MSKKVFIKTFGCQMNEYDSDKMADVLGAAQGYEPTQDVDEADLILFNTCSVTRPRSLNTFSCAFSRTEQVLNKIRSASSTSCVGS